VQTPDPGFAYTDLMLDPNDPKTGLRVSRTLGIAAMICLFAGALTPARAGGQTRGFVCANGQAFTARLLEGSAIVRTKQARLELPRKASSVGVKYSSTSATLIIDDSFASLVGRDLQRFERCSATSSLVNLR
jgi:hypothetical protein